MKSVRFFAIALAWLAVSIGTSGCRDELPTEDPLLADDDFFFDIESVDPGNNAAGVSTSASYGVKFSEPMDTASVSGNLHMAGGPAVHEWLDSLDQHCQMGGMAGSGKQNLMRWLDSLECTGTITWNDAHDSCAFAPDSALMPNALHIVYMTGDMRSLEGDAMPVGQLEYEGYLFFFSTAP